MFKSDHIIIGDDVTLGVSAFVHYGVTVEDGAVVAADSFVMKGTTLTRGSLWAGNPADEARAATTSADGARAAAVSADVLERALS